MYTHIHICIYTHACVHVYIYIYMYAVCNSCRFAIKSLARARTKMNGVDVPQNNTRRNPAFRLRPRVHWLNLFWCRPKRVGHDARSLLTGNQ